AADLTRQTEALDAARQALETRSYVGASVTALAKGEETFVPAGPAAAGARGVTWGTAVHRALELAARGMPEEVLRDACREILVEVERVDESGEPTEVDALLALVTAVRRSELWERARAARVRHLEVPILVAFRGEEARRLDAIAPAEAAEGAADRLVEGVIDLAFLEE